MPQEPSGQEPYKPKQSTSAVNLVNGLPLRPIIIAAVIILAIVLAYSFLSGNSQSSRYARLAAALSAGKPVTLAAVASTLSANTGSLSGLINSSSNLSYSGSGGLSAQITGLSLSIPFSYALTEQTNGSYSRADSKISIMHSALSEILINTPNITYECSDKNQSSGLLSGILGGNQSSTGTEHPDYACVASAPINISNSYSMQANEIINRILNNSFMNATKVSYTSTYMHRSCIFMAGYIYSNKINLGALVNTSSSSGAVSGTQASLLAPNDTLSFKGPYSLCASQSGTIYNFSFAPVVTLTSSGISGPQEYNISFNLNGAVTAIGKPASVSYISSAPYPIVNGTCTSGQVYLNPINYQASYSDLYFNCNQVDMNGSGYVRLSLSPASNPLALYLNSSSGQTPAGPVKILGLACTPLASANSSDSSFQPFSIPNASAFQPANITINPDAPATLIFQCHVNGIVRDKEYAARLYVVVAENSSIGPQTSSSELASISVLPTISGLIGANNNTGTVASNVSIGSQSSFNFNFTTTTVPQQNSGYTTIPQGVDALPYNTTIPTAAQAYMYPNVAVPYIVLDNQVSPFSTYIVLGNQYANNQTAQIFAQYPTLSETFGPGSVIVSSEGATRILVAGWSANDTVRAGNQFIKALLYDASFNNSTKSLTWSDIPITDSNGNLLVQVAVGSHATPTDWAVAEEIASTLKNLSVSQ